jgi:UPF0271 protein
LIRVVIDLNVDVGEGFATDSELATLMTSVNVACGFHAGDAQTMRTVCVAAVAAGASIGAHVSYRDRDGFGRRALPIDAETIAVEVGEQIEALQDAAASAGGRVAYVKPHGALYHRASSDPECAAAVVAAAAAATAWPLAMLAFPGSVLLALAHRAGLLAVAEGFADRGYAADGTLLPRSEPGSMLAADAAALQAVKLARGQLGGAVRSICVHGDTVSAGEVATRVRDALVSAGVELRAFA